MANKIQEARAQVAQLTQAAYEKAVEAGKLPAGAEVKATIEIPKDTAHGDYASSYAMAGAKALRMAPRAIAQTIVDHLDLEGSYFQKVEIAGPGFLNFTLGPKWYKEVLADVEREGAQYGANTEGNGEKVMVEFVSANPTGPMHMGNARGGVLGDTLANVLKRDGCDTWKEFYVNDAGNQIHKFAMSIDARYLQLVLGEENVPFPEDGYKGEDIIAHAKGFAQENGDKYVEASSEERRAALVAYALPKNIQGLHDDLARYRVHYDNWFKESTLHENGAVGRVVELLKEKGATYEKDGATWFHGEAYGSEDFVLVRSNGVPTYVVPDIAYHYDKLVTRGFDLAIDVLGADHHGYVPRLKGALSALGVDADKLQVVLMQMVRLVRIRYVDGVPAIYEEDYFSMKYEMLLGMQLDNRSIFGILAEEMNILPRNYVDEFRVQYPSAQQAKYLGIPPDKPLLGVFQWVLDANGDVIYHNDELIVTDSHTFTIRSHIE